MRAFHILFLTFLCIAHATTLPHEQNNTMELEQDNTWYAYFASFYPYLSPSSIFSTLQAQQYTSLEQLEHDIENLHEDIKKLNATSEHTHILKAYGKLKAFLTHLETTSAYQEKKLTQKQQQAIAANQSEQVEHLKAEYNSMLTTVHKLKKQYENNKLNLIPVCEQALEKSFQKSYEYSKNKEQLANSLFFDNAPNIPHHETQNRTVTLFTLYALLFQKTSDYIYVDSQQIKISNCLEKDNRVNTLSLQQLPTPVKQTVELIAIVKDLRNIPSGKKFNLKHAACISCGSDLRCRILEETIQHRLPSKK